jgi:hypothetical protein
MNWFARRDATSSARSVAPADRHCHAPGPYCISCGCQASHDALRGEQPRRRPRVLDSEGRISADVPARSEPEHPWWTRFSGARTLRPRGSLLQGPRRGGVVEAKVQGARSAPTSELRTQARTASNAHRDRFFRPSCRTSVLPCPRPRRGRDCPGMSGSADGRAVHPEARGWQARVWT